MEPESSGLLQAFHVETDCPTGPQSFGDRMVQLFGIGLAITSPSAPFRAGVKAYCGRRLRFAEIGLSPHTTSSSPGGASSTRLLVSLQKAGVATVQQGGRESRIEPGDLFLLDPARPFSIETSEIVTRSVYLEPEALRAVLPQWEGLTALARSCARGAGALYRGLVDELCTLAGELTEPAAERIADALPHVLAAALADMSVGVLPPSRLRSLHKLRILQFVRENLRNHELDAELVAASVSLSMRYVYELFEDEGKPLMKWIWSLRLDHCRSELATPSYATRSIGEIAFSWGFNDVAHFSRAFRQRFGTSPREFRASQLARV